MLRLTVRSSRDGRFLCRIVDRGHFPFVLDFGDQRIIDDASQRLQHGFTMWRHGALITVPPQDPLLLKLLADFYAGEGLLVFLEEPTWPGRRHSLEDRLPGPAAGDLTLLDPVVLEPSTSLEDASTELVEIRDIPSVDDFLEPETPGDPEDAP